MALSIPSAIAFVLLQAQFLDADAEQASQRLGVPLVGPGAIHLPTPDRPFAHTELPGHRRRAKCLGVLSGEFEATLADAVRHGVSLANPPWVANSQPTWLAYACVGVESVAYGGGCP